VWVSFNPYSFRVFSGRLHAYCTLYNGYADYRQMVDSNLRYLVLIFVQLVNILFVTLQRVLPYKKNSCNSKLEECLVNKNKDTSC
jgi:hypothetical protein